MASLTPWDIPAPNADVPERRVVPIRPHRLANLMRDDAAGYANPDGIQKLRDRLNGQARNITVGPARARDGECSSPAHHPVSMVTLALAILSWGVVAVCYWLLASGAL